MVFDLRPLQCPYAERGIGRYTRELLRALRAQLAENPEYQLLGLSFRGEKVPEGMPEGLTCPRTDRVWLWDQTVLPLLLFQRGMRIFHSCAALGPLKEVNFPILFAKRSVLTVHDWHMFSDQASPLEKFYRATRRIRWQKRFLSKAARIVTDSACIARETAALGSVLKNRLIVNSPGGDHLDWVQGLRTGHTRYFLSIGDGPHKGLDTAYRALTKVRETGLELKWVVVGDAKKIGSLLGWEKDNPPWVHILRPQSDAELKGLYQSALGLLFPSRREGFGFPVLEAMRAGCPVLVSDIEPLSDLIEDAESRIPADHTEGFAQVIERLTREDGWREQKRARGLDFSKKFTWKRTAKQTLCEWNLIFTAFPDSRYFG